MLLVSNIFNCHPEMGFRFVARSITGQWTI